MRLILVLIFSCAVASSSAHARSCSSIIAATVLLGASSSRALASLVNTSNPWPFERFSYLRTEPSPQTLPELVDLAHTRFEDAYYFGGVTAVYDIQNFPQDRFRNPLSSPWVSVDGGWNTVVIAAPSFMPPGVNFGTQVILDPTPHTPGLFQWTEISWARFPFFIEITHKAWVIAPDPYKYDFTVVPERYTADYRYVPAPASLIALGLGTTMLGRRRR